MVLVFIVQQVMEKRIKDRGGRVKYINCIVGASGSGKSSLLEQLVTPVLVSHTTRKKRENEVEGEDYYFVSEQEFKKLNFIEEVTFAGRRYGLSHKEVHNKFKNNREVTVIVDIEGYKQLKELYKDQAVILFYIDSSPWQCFKRMYKDRGFISAAKRVIRDMYKGCLLYTSPSPRDRTRSRMPSSA